jgi:SpoVK/Ycf46/Vps4 family AAA+-type ATPase
MERRMADSLQIRKNEGVTTKELEIDVLLRARYPLLYIVSPEEARVEDALKRIADGRKQVLVWSATQPTGFSQQYELENKNSNSAIVLDGNARALEALESITRRIANDERVIFILRDFDAFLENPLTVRRLRDVVALLKRSYSTIVLLSPVLLIPPHLEKDVVVVHYDLPGFHELGEILDELLQRVQEGTSTPDQLELDEVTRESLIKAALGLTADEANNVFAKALVLKGSGALDIQIVLHEKKQIIRKTGALEFYETAENLQNIGGLEQLKSWLQKRGAAFSEKAREFGLPSPRGVLLLGVPGCGKSLTAKAVGEAWNLPLLRFDVGSVFGKYVGESEANLRRALHAAEAVAPCVLWVDELEKAFSSGRGEDGGTTLRILGAFLSWLQEKSTPVFVVATANNVENLPPELLRKGRLDEIFFVDLPRENERRAIFAIHLNKHGRDASTFDLETLAQKSEGYSGAEIEQSVIAALYDAFDQKRDVSTPDVLINLQAMVPLSITMQEEVAALRDWASTRARAAS